MVSLRQHQEDRSQSDQESQKSAKVPNLCSLQQYDRQSITDRELHLHELPSGLIKRFFSPDQDLFHE